MDDDDRDEFRPIDVDRKHFVIPEEEKPVLPRTTHKLKKNNAITVSFNP